MPVSAGLVPLALAVARGDARFSGLIFDRCISINSRVYFSDIDNRLILGRLSNRGRCELGIGAELAGSRLPVLAFEAFEECRIADGDKLRFRLDQREDLIQLHVSGGHASIPWDVDRLKCVLRLAFLNEYVF